MGTERCEQHLKQIVLNVKYEHEAGRLSAINLAALVVDKIPEPLLEQHAQLFFLPLTMQLANDDSKQCREAVADCLIRLLKRLPTDVVLSLFEFACRWSQGKGELTRTSLQLFGFFVDARTDVMKRGEKAAQLVDRLTDIIDQTKTFEADWEIFYFSLVCLEKLSKHFSPLIARRFDLWTMIAQNGLIHPHPFVKLITSRLIWHHLEHLDATSFAETSSKKLTFLVERPGSLYEIGRNFCFQLNVDEDQQKDELVALCIKNLTWILQAMQQYPHLCRSNNNNDDVDNDGEEDAYKNATKPVAWVMTRLSNIAKPGGTKRRQAVFKAFAALTVHCGHVVFPYMELMLAPLHRADIEATNSSTKTPSSSFQTGPNSDPSAEATLARDVLHLLEEKCEPPEEFVRAYAAVKARAREKKEARKMLEKSEAIRDPQTAAKRRQEKQVKQKNRRKRRVEERRFQRGGQAKRRHL